MKKLLSLMLCLMLCLPVFAMAEDITTAPVYNTVDFGTFTVDFAPTDYYQVADEMVNNELFAIIYPDYDDNATSHHNINIIWTQANGVAEASSFGAEKYAKLVLESAKPQYEAMGIKLLNSQVVNASVEEDAYVSLTCYTLDYTGAGIDLVAEQYQMQLYVLNEAEETYIFTLTASTMDYLQELLAYLDRVNFK